MTKSSLRTRSQPISKLHRTHARPSARRLSFVARGRRACDARERNGRRNERRSIKSTRSDASTTTTLTTTSHDSKLNPPTDTHITSHHTHHTLHRKTNRRSIDRFFVPSSLSPMIQYHNTLYIYVYYIDICLLVYICVIFIIGVST